LQNFLKKRNKKAQGKDSIKKKVSSEQASRDSPSENQNKTSLTTAKQESSGKEKGFHKMPYSNQ
jgi:hypothetical protein